MDNSYKIFDEDFDENEANEFLIQEYGYDLFDFAYSLAIVLSKEPPPSPTFRDIWSLKKSKIPDYEYDIVADEVKKLERIIKSVIHRLCDHESVMEKIKNPLFPKKEIPKRDFNEFLREVKRAYENIGWEKREVKKLLSFVKKTYKNGKQQKSKVEIRESYVKRKYDFDRRITDEIYLLRGCLNYFKKSKGRPAVSKNVIASLWSVVMRDSEEIHFENIDKLSNWFHLKLEGVTYRDELDVYPSHGEILRFVKSFRPIIEEAKKGIFFHDYKTKEFEDKEKVYAFKIRFEKDNPEFCPIDSSSENDISSLIKFPETTS